ATRPQSGVISVKGRRLTGPGDIARYCQSIRRRATSITVLRVWVILFKRRRPELTTTTSGEIFGPRPSSISTGTPDGLFIHTARPYSRRHGRPALRHRCCAYSSILPPHIPAGAVALLPGPHAFVFRNGSPRHILAGKVFVVA